jgi:hypothetical protein
MLYYPPPPRLGPGVSHSGRLLTKNVSRKPGTLHFSGIDQFRPPPLRSIPCQRKKWRRSTACACQPGIGAHRTVILQTVLAATGGYDCNCVFLCDFSGRTAILEFFSTRKLAELAESLARDVARRYPPAIANNPAQMVSQRRLSGILEEVFARATQFSRENKLGWYKRAKLTNDFRWELAELGYDDKFVDAATEGLILHVTRNPARAS